ncbi:hypothetical protein K9L97_02415 [Candidatus Woesearchaeota archaeon]|nr:hypothetical protein [Candidatus Woesearchaeota archaeon]
MIQITEEIYRLYQIQHLDLFKWTLIQNLEQKIQRANIKECRVELLKENNNIKKGKTRIPFLITTHKQKFVIKSYDIYSKIREAKIIKQTESTIGPKILYLGEDFLIEEYIHPNSYETLWSKVNEQIPETIINAFTESAIVHAKLAKFNVFYNHNHWLDEFHKNHENYKVTDFGTSILINELKDIEKQKKIIDSQLHTTIIEQINKLNTQKEIKHILKMNSIYTKNALYDKKNIIDITQKKMIQTFIHEYQKQ